MKREEEREEGKHWQFPLNQGWSMPQQETPHCTSMQTRTHTPTLRLTRVSYFGRNLPHQCLSSWEALGKQGSLWRGFSRKGLDLSRGRKSDVKPTCPMRAQPSVRPLRATREASPAHLPPSCRAPSQPDGRLVYGFGVQSLYRLFYFLKILQYSAVLERHVSSSYAKLITCHFRCQVQKVFRRRVKRTWLGEETGVSSLCQAEMRRQTSSYSNPGGVFFLCYWALQWLKTHWERWWDPSKLILYSSSSSVSHSVMSNSLQTSGLKPTSLLCPWDSPGKNTGVGGHSLLQGIFPTQGLNRGLLHCRQILYCLSH